MKNINKIIYSVLIILGISLLFNTKTYAANMAMSINKSSAYVGDSFVITISGVNGRVNISASSNISIDKSGSQFIDGSLTINGNAISTGTGTVTVTPVDVTTTAAEPEEVTSVASRSITITEKVIATQTPKVTIKATPKNNKVEVNTPTPYIEQTVEPIIEMIEDTPSSEPIEIETKEPQTEEVIEEKTTPKISMPVWLFILLQILIILVELIIIFVIRNIKFKSRH